MTKTDTRKLSRSAQEAIRHKAVQAVAEGRMTQTGAAKVFGVSRTSVCLWVKAYHERGESALKTKRQGRPKGGALGASQATGIRKSILGRCPDQLRLPGFLWTRDIVSELIERRHGISLSRWTVGRYLKDWGLAPQKPARRALEQNPAQVRYWLREKYPAISRQAKEENARIWWGDETGLRSDHQTGTTWGEKGQTPVVKKSGKRFGCNMISAITNQGDLRFMVFGQHFTVKVFLEFLGRLTRSEAGRKVFLIVDRHSVHKSRQVEKWIDENAERIRLFFLPAYSPELNPDELLNQDLKGNVHREGKVATKVEMMSRTRAFLRSRLRRPATVRKYFEGKQVVYAAAA
jgi:transposase